MKSFAYRHEVGKGKSQFQVSGPGVSFPVFNVNVIVIILIYSCSDFYALTTSWGIKLPMRATFGHLCVLISSLG